MYTNSNFNVYWGVDIVNKQNVNKTQTTVSIIKPMVFICRNIIASLLWLDLFHKYAL